MNLIETFTTHMADASTFITTHAAVIIAYSALILVFMYKEKYIQRLRRDMKLYTGIMKTYKDQLQECEKTESELRISRRDMMRDLHRERKENGRYRETLRKLEKEMA